MLLATMAKYRRSRGAGISAGAFLLAAAVSCSSPTGTQCPTPVQPADQTSRVSISQGIAGNVWEWVGAFPACGTITAVSRTVLVYPPTPIAPAGSGNDGSYWSSFPVAALDSARSDASGFVQLPLPAGQQWILCQPSFISGRRDRCGDCRARSGESGALLDHRARSVLTSRLRRAGGRPAARAPKPQAAGASTPSQGLAELNSSRPHALRYTKSCVL